MNQSGKQPLEQNSIELLKAARNQVTPDRKGRDENQNILKTETPPTLQQERPTIQSRFTENFIQKVVSIEQEIVKLENRRNELIKVKNKLIALDKEMSNILNRNDL